MLDRERHLRFDFNALADLEAHLGINITNPEAFGSMGLRVVRGMLWAALLHETPGLSVRDTGELIQQYLEDGGGDLSVLGTKLVEALTLAGFGAPKTGEADAAPLAPETTG
jgi:hypothetical protein